MKWAFGQIQMDAIDPETGTEYTGDDPVEAARVVLAAIRNLDAPYVLIYSEDRVWNVDTLDGTAEEVTPR